MRAWSRRPEFWLLAVAIGYLAVMLVVVVPQTPLGADEALYASQVDPNAPAQPFTAPRARGITWLIAPIVYATHSTTALRSYLAVLAAIALVVAYWPWLRALRRPALVPFGALLFAGTWTALFYGADDMPDVWVAFSAVAAIGWFVRYMQGKQVRALAGLCAAIVVMTVMRPGDALWILLPLVVAMLAVPRLRQRVLLGAVLAAAAVGVTPWIVEAYLHYGGVFARLHKSSQEQGGLGFHPRTVLDTLRSLTGPMLCRPCSVSAQHFASIGTDLYVLWWLAMLALAGIGVLAAKRRGELLPFAVPAACAVTVGGFYVLGVAYSAPRFLLPVFALLSLAMAAGIDHVVHAVRGMRRRAAVGLAALFVVAELVSQLVVLDTQSDRPGVTRSAADRIAPYVDRPCLMVGLHRTQLAYLARCNSIKKVGARGLSVAARTEDVALLTASSRPPRGYAGWRRVRLPLSGEHWYAYVPPRQN